MIVVHKKIIKYGLFLTVILSLFLGPGINAEASYNTRFESEKIKIISPNVNNLKYEGILPVTGESNLEKVWFCVKGPAGNLTTYSADVKDGEFKQNLYLRFGPGKYTVWAGDNPNNFNGSIYFTAVNTFEKQNPYSTPSAYVNSNNNNVVKLTNSMLEPGMSDFEKLEKIHGWITGNLTYDYKAYKNELNQLNTASEILEKNKGICRDFTFLTAAMARAAGLKAKVVYGYATNNSDWSTQLHAWNEVYADNRWVKVDTTWDAGYIKNNRFIHSPSTEFLDPDTKLFSKTHQPTTYTVH